MIKKALTSCSYFFTVYPLRKRGEACFAEFCLEGTTTTQGIGMITYPATVVFDAVYVPGGEKSVSALIAEGDPVHFINEAYKHCKAIAFDGEGKKLLEKSYVEYNPEDKNVINALATEGVLLQTGKAAKDFIAAIAQHRFWEREMKGKVPA